MENATKALLIVATLLIVIAIVATGVLILKNVSNTSGQAKVVGDSIGLETEEAIREYQKNYMTKEEFNGFINYFQTTERPTSNGFLNIIKNEQNVKLKNQIQVIGYVYIGDNDFNKRQSEILGKNSNNQSLEKHIELMRDTVINELKNSGELKATPIGGLQSHKAYYLKIYAKKRGYITNYNSYDDLEQETKEQIEQEYNAARNSGEVTSSWDFCWSYDKDGYIDKVYYIAHLDF